MIASAQDRPKRILLVGFEDEKGLQVRNALKSCGYALHLAAGPLDASRQLLEKGIDVLLISALLGVPVLEALRVDLCSGEGRVPLLVVGELAGGAPWDSWPSPGPHLLLREPFDPGDVLDAVRKLLDDQTRNFGPRTR